jgi:4-hydroxy-4-methyl-2-oxoglutarate aldolase
VATEKELAAVRGRLFGMIDEKRIRAVEIDRPSKSIIDGFRALTDLSSTISDALDTSGVAGGVSGNALVPRLPGTKIVGPAITIRYAPERRTHGSLVAREEPGRLADRDLYNIGEPGDVAVFDCGGWEHASVMGGLSAAWAKRLAIAGCVIDGAARDLDSIRENGIPVWSRALTPVSGKHRLAATEINGIVTIGGVCVEPGDVVAADDTGVCVIPSEHAAVILELCRKIEEAERSVVDAIRSGGSSEELAEILRPERW